MLASSALASLHEHASPELARWLKKHRSTIQRQVESRVLDWWNVDTLTVFDTARMPAPWRTGARYAVADPEREVIVDRFSDLAEAKRFLERHRYQYGRGGNYVRRNPRRNPHMELALQDGPRLMSMMRDPRLRLSPSDARGQFLSTLLDTLEERQFVFPELPGKQYRNPDGTPQVVKIKRHLKESLLQQPENYYVLGFRPSDSSRFLDQDQLPVSGYLMQHSEGLFSSYGGDRGQACYGNDDPGLFHKFLFAEYFFPLLEKIETSPLIAYLPGWKKYRPDLMKAIHALHTWRHHPNKRRINPFTVRQWVDDIYKVLVTRRPDRQKDERLPSFHKAVLQFLLALINTMGDYPAAVKRLWYADELLEPGPMEGKLQLKRIPEVQRQLDLIQRLDGWMICEAIQTELKKNK